MSQGPRLVYLGWTLRQRADGWRAYAPGAVVDDHHGIQCASRDSARAYVRSHRTPPVARPQREDEYGSATLPRQRRAPVCKVCGATGPQYSGMMSKTGTVLRWEAEHRKTHEGKGAE